MISILFILSECSGGVDPPAITPPKVADEARSKHIQLLWSKTIVLYVWFCQILSTIIKQDPTQAPAWQVSRHRLCQLEVIENLLKEEKRFRQLCELKKRQDELQHLENLKLESVKPVEHKIIPALPPQQCTMASVRCKLFCLNIFYFWSWCQTSQPLWFIPGMDTMETQPLLDSGLCASTLLLDSVAYILYMLAYTRIAYI